MKITYSYYIKNNGDVHITAKDRNKIVGYIDAKPIRDQADLRNLCIEYVYVHPQHRRMGIATKMIILLLKKIKNYVWVQMWTGKQIQQDKAYNIYNKLGFEQLCIQEDYYRPGVPARFYAMRLK